MSHLEFLYGARIYGCKACNAHFATIEAMISRVCKRILCSSKIYNDGFGLMKPGVPGVPRPTRESLPIWDSVGQFFLAWLLINLVGG